MKTIADYYKELFKKVADKQLELNK